MLPLLEVVRAEQTDDATLATAFAVGEQLKSSCVLVADAPAFVVNRCSPASSRGGPAEGGRARQVVGVLGAGRRRPRPRRQQCLRPAHPSPLTEAQVRDRAVEALAREIRLMLDEGVVQAVQDVDLCLGHDRW